MSAAQRIANPSVTPTANAGKIGVSAFFDDEKRPGNIIATEVSWDFGGIGAIEFLISDLNDGNDDWDVERIKAKYLERR